MSLSSQQLDHLAHLCSLKLTDQEKTTLLPHLEKILGFVGKLEECDVEGVAPLAHPQDDVTLQTWSGKQEDGPTPDELLQNVKHPLNKQAIGVQPPN